MMLPKRKLRNKSGGEGTSAQEEVPVKKSLRKPNDEQEEQKERPVRALRQREKSDVKDAEDNGDKQKPKGNEKKIKTVEKSKENDHIELKEVDTKSPKDDKDESLDDKKYESVVGPIRMSDRKSGDANMFGAKLLPVTIKISKSLLKPKVLNELRDESTSKTSNREKSATKSPSSEKEGNCTTKRDPQATIIKLVESPAFDELDITSKIEILDTSKKKLEEIKRKSEEQQENKIEAKEKEKVASSEKVKIRKISPTTDKGKANTVELATEKLDPKEELQKVEPKEELEKVREEKWKEGEKILCFHGPLIYDAKIQRVEIQNGIPKYFIHYHGWNKNWDEMVPEARMLKFCERNVEIQKDLCRAHEAKEKAKKMKQKQDHVFAIPKTPSPVPKKENQGRRKSGLKPKKREDNHTDEFLVKNGKQVNLMPPDSTVESEEQFRTKLEIKIKIPEELKSYIVDDWNQICKKKRLCVLPAKITADQMINEYTRAKTLNKAEKMKNNKEKAIIEVTAGVREYFNVMLSSQLLYKPERNQYDQLIRAEPNMVPCKTYGVVHLLRLFTKLGEMLIYTPLSEKSINLLLFYVNDMLMYMKRNASLIFSLADYTQDAPM